MDKENGAGPTAAEERRQKERSRCSAGSVIIELVMLPFSWDLLSGGGNTL
jgi:hypothetical protein